jgi:radical SAM protein with 4Fe4S-binding SPASM domain
MENDRLTKLSGELGVDNLSNALFFPKFFEVETVNACNAKCKMCTIGDWAKRGSYLMSDVVWDKFIGEIKDYRQWIDRVNVSRDGEPLMDSKLENRIKDLKRESVRFVTLATNGSLLDNNRAKAMLDSGLDDIMFSIDGFTKETYEKIRIGLKFEEVVDNCVNFIKIRDTLNYKTTVRVRMVLQDENKAELPDWMKFWKPFLRQGDRVYAKPAHSWGNQLKGYENITPKLVRKDYSEETCVSPWSTLVLKVNGDIPLCPVDFRCNFLMGNINDSTIKEIWNSGGFNKVRDKLIIGERNSLSLCRNCYLWDRETVVEK